MVSGQPPCSPIDDRARHIDLVDVRPLLAIDLDIDEQPVHDGGDVVVLEAFMRHDMAPVAGGIADGEQDRPMPAPWLRPGPPATRPANARDCRCAAADRGWLRRQAGFAQARSRAHAQSCSRDGFAKLGRFGESGQMIFRRFDCCAVQRAPARRRCGHPHFRPAKLDSLVETICRSACLSAPGRDLAHAEGAGRIAARSAGWCCSFPGPTALPARMSPNSMFMAAAPWSRQMLETHRWLRGRPACGAGRIHAARLSEWQARPGRDGGAGRSGQCRNRGAAALRRAECRRRAERALSRLAPAADPCAGDDRGRDRLCR